MSEKRPRLALFVRIASLLIGLTLLLLAGLDKVPRWLHPEVANATGMLGRDGVLFGLCLGFGIAFLGVVPIKKSLWTSRQFEDSWIRAGGLVVGGGYVVGLIGLPILLTVSIMDHWQWFWTALICIALAIWLGYPIYDALKPSAKHQHPTQPPDAARSNTPKSE